MKKKLINMRRENKLELGLKFFFLGLCVVYYVFLIFGGQMFGNASLFYRSFNLFSGAGDPNVLIRLVSYVFFCLSISWAVRFVLKRIGKLLHKGRAIIDIICSLIKYVAVIVLLFLVLKSFGVDTAAILSGIGILTLIIGLGAQPLITDIIAGLFIVFENVFEVGDIIVIDGFRGTVKEIGIRATKIEDAGGNIKVVNNSDLRSLVNMTENLSLACCDMSIEYGESLERVEAILKNNLAKIKENIPDIVEGPFYRGVTELGNSAVVLRFVAQCDESVKYQVERDMNRQFKLLFDQNNINIPFPQIVVNKPITFEEANKKEKKEASQFVEEQREILKNIPDSENNEIK